MNQKRNFEWKSIDGNEYPWPIYKYSNKQQFNFVIWMNIIYYYLFFTYSDRLTDRDNKSWTEYVFNIEIYQLKSIRINNPVLLKNYYHRDNPSFDGHTVLCIPVFVMWKMKFWLFNDNACFTPFLFFFFCIISFFVFTLWIFFQIMFWICWSLLWCILLLGRQMTNELICITCWNVYLSIKIVCEIQKIQKVTANNILIIINGNRKSKMSK